MKCLGCFGDAFIVFDEIGGGVEEEVEAVSAFGTGVEDVVGFVEGGECRAVGDGGAGGDDVHFGGVGGGGLGLEGGFAGDAVDEAGISG